MVCILEVYYVIFTKINLGAETTFISMLKWGGDGRIFLPDNSIALPAFAFILSHARHVIAPFLQVTVNLSYSPTEVICLSFRYQTLLSL